MRLIALLLAITLPVFVLACSDDSPASPTATPRISDGLPTAVVGPTGAATALPQASPGATALAFEGSTDSYAFAGEPRGAAMAALLVNVRVGEHDGFDRIVFEFEDGQRPSGLVEYVDDVAQCGSGFPVDPDGSHVLKVRFDVTNAHTEAGVPTIDSNQIAGPGNSILESESICDFEAVVEWAVGVDGEQPFKVTLLEGPNRVVIDVAH